MQINFLHTERLRLKIYDQKTCDYIFNNYSDKELIHFLALNSEEELEKEKIKYAKGFSTYNKTFLNFYLIEKESDTAIGWCGFHNWYLEHNRAEIGYTLFDDLYKNMGFMTEALHEIIPYGFEEMDLHRIEAYVGSENIPSQKLMSNFGFTFEGNLREHYLKNGVFEDSLVYSKLRED